MHYKTVITILSLASVAALCGCYALAKPSAATRRASYVRFQNWSKADESIAEKETFLVISGNARLAVTDFAWNNQGLNFKCNAAFDTGLSASLTHDGYLLTASHVAGTTNYVVGWCHNQLDVYPARVVFREGNPDRHNDVTLLKISANPDYCAELGDAVQPGQRVICIVCDDMKTFGAIGFAGGTVVSTTKTPAGTSADLIYGDIPVWFGDSGGPILISSGKLVGVTIGGESYWYGRLGRSIGAHLDKQTIENAIEADRSRVR